MIKKDIVFAVLITAFFMSVLFMLLPTRSAEPIREYDPWADVDGSGTINIIDLTLVAKAYLTSGPPINHSAYIIPGYFNSPIWDSGWTNCKQGNNVYYFNRTIDTTNAFVYVYGRNSTSGGAHQIDYGGEKNGLSDWGICWQDLTSTSVTIRRGNDDENWNQVRILIWRIYPYSSFRSIGII